jgi:hypothetical protein
LGFPPSRITLEFTSELNIHFRVMKSYTYWPKMGNFQCMSRDLWILCLWPLCCPVCSTYHKWVFVVHVRLVNFMSKLLNVC